jgi:hypothetical protein
MEFYGKPMSILAIYMDIDNMVDGLLFISIIT